MTKQYIVVIGSDHAGFDMKQSVKKFLLNQDWFVNGHSEIVDVGCNGPDRCDYPDIAFSIIEKIKEFQNDRVFGVAICGTGIGMSICLNRDKHIRAALCHDGFTTEMSRRHNNANVIALGARVIGYETAQHLVKQFMTTSFDKGRHLDRINKFSV